MSPLVRMSAVLLLGATLVPGMRPARPRLLPGLPEPFDEPAEAQAFHARKRAPQGQTAVPAERYLAARERMRTMRRYSTRDGRFLPRTRDAAALSAGALGVWTPLGPGNIGGRTRALVIVPTAPSTMYAAGVAGGVWKTTNAGSSWAPLDDFMANLAVTVLALDPASANVLYAGTGEGFFNIDAVRGAGIFKTTDAGATFSQLPATATSNFHYVNDVLVSTNDSARIYAATRTGVWRSLNSGTSFTQILSQGGEGCLDLLERPGGPGDEIFVSCGSFSGGTVRRATNADGASPTFNTVLGPPLMARTTLAIAPSDPNVLYALAASNDFAFDQGLHSVFRSTNGGLTWTVRVDNADPVKLNTLLLTNPVIASLADCFGFFDSYLHQGWYDNVIAVDPVDPNRVWVGGIDLFRSDDGGANFGLASYWWADPSDPGYAHADQHAIVFHPGYDGVTNRTMFVGNDGGLFRTDNARAPVATGLLAACDPANTGVTWTDLNNGYGVTQFYYGVPYPGGATYFGGTQDNGTLRGNDGSGPEAWASVLGGDGGAVAVDPTNTNVLYAEFTGLSIQKSTDGGANWADATAGIDGFLDGGFLFIAPFLMDPGNPQRLWTGGNYLWRTIDGAGSWSQASDTLSLSASVSALAVHPTDGNRVLAGRSDGAIHRTTIGLTSGPSTVWAAASPRSGYVSGLGFHPANPQIAYATYSTFGGVHVWKTINGGATWTDADGSGATGIPDLPAHAVVVDASNPSRVYVGTDLGVFVSTDAGLTWAVENTGFANVVTESLTREGNDLFAFTHGRGAWRVAAVGPTLSVNDVSVTEGDTGSVNAVFTVTLTAPWSVDVTVDYATAGDTALPGLDFTTTTGQLTIPVGSVSGTVTVPVLGDLVDEPSERFFLDLTNPVGGATLGDARGDGTILDDDPVPSVSVDDVEVVEGNGGPTAAIFTLSLSNPSASIITVPFATADASAQAPGDYASATSSAVFPPGVLTRPVAVNVNGDLLPEPDETFLLRLLPPVGAAVLADAEGVGTIRNDDPFPVDDVLVLTLRATSGETVLEWLNPGAPYVSTLIHRATAAPFCAFPVDPNPLLPTFLAEVPGAAGTPGTFTDATGADGTTYCYTAFVKRDLTPSYSAGRNVAGRPFATTGPVKWAYTTAATAVTPPGLGASAVYAVSNDRVVHAMGRGLALPAAGKWPQGPPAWAPFILGGPAQSRPPAVPGGAGTRLLVGSQDGFVYAIDAVSGALLWQTPSVLGDDVQAAPAALLSAFGAPFDRVMVGSRTPAADNTFYGLDAATGVVAWSYAGEPGDRIGIVNGGASVDYATRRAYFASRARGPGQSTLWCVNVTAGAATLAWKRALGDIDGSPVLRNGVVYVGTTTGVVHALDATSGASRWSFTTGDGPVKGFLFPERSNQDLFFSTTASVWGLQDDGLSASQKWAALTSVPSPSTPVHPAGTTLLYVGGGDGKLYEIDYAVAGFPSPPPVVTFVALGDPLAPAAVGAPTYDAALGVVYVGTVVGIVYAIVPPLP